MSLHKKKVYLSAPHMSGKERAYVDEALDTNWIAPLGPHVDAFEQSIAAYAGVKDAVAVSSGTAAIHLALRLLDVGPEDTVFCSSLTFVASANPIVYLGAQPVFIDSEPDTWNMSPQALEQALHEASKEGKLPKAVVVVHLYGQSAKMDDILALCDAYHVPIIEDAAESLGSTYKGHASGSLGRFGIYSFNGNKIITTSSGGMLISNDEDAMRRARFLASQAKDQAPHYQHTELGYNYRLSNVLAGIGRAQLEVLDQRVAGRRAIYDTYVKALSGYPGFQFLPEWGQTRSNRWLTTMLVDDREAALTVTDLLRALDQESIEARHVWKPLHLQPLFAGNRYYAHDENTSVSESLFQKGICLPSGTGMSVEDQDRVIECIAKAAEQALVQSAKTYYVS